MSTTREKGHRGAAWLQENENKKNKKILTPVRTGAGAAQQAEPGVPVVRAGLGPVGVRARVAAAGVLVRVREDARVLFCCFFFREREREKRMRKGGERKKTGTKNVKEASGSESSSSSSTHPRVRRLDRAGDDLERNREREGERV